MLSLITVFSLMMLPAIAMLAISFLVSAFENNSSALTNCESSSLIQSFAS